MATQGDVTAADGRTVRYYDTGESPDAGLTVFWHHGTPQTGRLLAPIVDAAARRGMRIVSCARAGYEGTSDIPGRTVAAAAADVVRVADELGIPEFATMGASGGGPHALAAAALAPDRVVGVVTLAGIAPFTTEYDWFGGMASQGGLRSALEGRAARAEYAETAEFDEASFTEADFRILAGPWAVLGEDAQRASGAGAAGEIDDDVAFTKPWGFELGDVLAPTLLVQGGQDRVVPASHARWILDRLPAGELWSRPRDGHVSVLAGLPVALDWLAETVRSAGATPA